MRLAAFGILRANAHAKQLEKIKLFELAVNSCAIAAGHQREQIRRIESFQKRSRARQQTRIFALIALRPELVRELPLRTRDFRGAIHAIPIRRVMTREIAAAEFDS